jgi:hypothetical protein
MLGSGSGTAVLVSSLIGVMFILAVPGTREGIPWG